MVIGLDISTSITGVTVIDKKGDIILNEAWDLRKYKDFFEKARFMEDKLKWFFLDVSNSIDTWDWLDAIYIEQSLQSFRSGFSSAKTLSTLARFNGLVSWLCYKHLNVKPEYIAATSARKKCGIKVPKGTKAKEVVLKYVVDNVPDVTILYTKHGNPKPECFDKADSWVVARAGYLCQQEKSSQL